jgi:hypothetical protein
MFEGKKYDIPTIILLLFLIWGILGGLITFLGIVYWVLSRYVFSCLVVWLYDRFKEK